MKLTHIDLDTENEIARLRKALEFYADRSKYEGVKGSRNFYMRYQTSEELHQDAGEIARIALGVKSS